MVEEPKKAALHTPQTGGLDQADKITRREFVRHVGLLGMTLAGASRLLSACSSTEQAEEAAEPTATTEVAAEPTATPSKRGGVFRLAGDSDIRSLDPPAAEYSEDWWSAGCILYNQLYFFDTDGKIYADLASEMPTISEDGTVYTIPLRKGVKFHNGREMVADDVKFSLEHQLWPETYSWGKGYMESVIGYQDVIDGNTKDLSGVKVIDDYTISITLNKAQAAFLNLLTYSMNGIIPKQECLDAGDDWGNEVIIGTGPFKFVEWERGAKAVYERYPDYHFGAPNLDRIELYLNLDAGVQLLRWENRELEYVRYPPEEAVPSLLTDPKYAKSIQKTATCNHHRLCFNFASERFQDIRVRQAAAHAIDKDGFIKAYGGRMNRLEGFYNPKMMQYDPNFKSDYQYDPEKAKQLLAEAGYPDGISDVKLYVAVGLVRIGELVQADLSKVGIEATLVPGEWKEWRDPIRAGDVELFLYEWASSAPDAYDYVSAWCTCASIETGFNDGHYCNERIDQLLDEAERYALQDPERASRYREIEDTIINKDVAFVGLGNPVAVSLLQEYCHDAKPFFVYSAWPRLETAWMET